MKITAFAVLLLGCLTGFAQSLTGLCMLSDAHRANHADRVQLCWHRPTAARIQGTAQT